MRGLRPPVPPLNEAVQEEASQRSQWAIGVVAAGDCVVGPWQRRRRWCESSSSYLLPAHGAADGCLRGIHRTSWAWAASPGIGFGRPGRLPEIVFSLKESEIRRLRFLLLALAGDIESNPGPRPTYTCPVCSQPITSAKKYKGSVLCNSCRNWVHTSCTTLANSNQHTSAWTCSKCPSTPVIPSNSAPSQLASHPSNTSTQLQLNLT